MPTDVDQPPRRDTLARALGWTSLGLGLPQVVRPGAIAHAVGAGGGARPRLVTTTVGVRELVSAAGLLGHRGPAWLWARVGGDAIDLALLGRLLKDGNGRDVRRTAAAAAAVVGIAVVDAYAAITRSRATARMELSAAVTVGTDPERAYSHWRHLEHLPAFMAHVDEVRTTGHSTSHWRVSAPFGRTVEWDAEITEEAPGKRLSWRAKPGADIANSGTVRFVPAPGGRGTEVHVQLCYEMPGGKLGEAIARYFGEDPHQQLDDDLRRFKQVIETGEVVRSDGAPGGKRAREEFPQHPARPLAPAELTKERQR